MPLEAGTHLGPYVIVSPIGEGGMGEVYRARDTRLGRTVAPETLFEGEHALEYDIAPDGKHFAMIKNRRSGGGSQLNVISGGTEEIERRVSLSGGAARS